MIGPTQAEHDLIMSMTGDIVRTALQTAAPEIIRIVAAARPHIAVAPAEELLALEPVPSRDYRKECWIAAFSAALGCADVPVGQSLSCADLALTAFDARFPA
jgi:hypothetical protein